MSNESGQQRRRVVIVSPHFAPSNATAGQRSRLVAAHLPKYGWDAHILSVEPRFYEETPDWDLLNLLPKELIVTRTAALPVRPLRLIGDLGVRSLLWHYRALSKLAREGQIDLLYIPIPPNFSALLGPLLYLRYKVPYAIDYIDPWVHPWPGSEKLFGKAWFSYRLGQLLEPPVLRYASLVTGVAPGYYDKALQRNAPARSRATLSFPYGAEPGDFAYLASNGRPPTLFDPSDGDIHVVYTGTMLPRAHAAMTAVFEAVRRLSDLHGADRLKLHFIGTGNAAATEAKCVLPLAERVGVAHLVREYPGRIPYLDALNHLKAAHAVLVVGSSEAHYTASKIFPAILSARPLIALLHSQSTAASILADADACCLTTFDEAHPASERGHELTEAFAALIRGEVRAPRHYPPTLNEYSAETLVGRLATAFDAVLTETNWTPCGARLSKTPTI